MPSSIRTSITLPVTLEETVAARRAVTYPEAFRTVWALLVAPTCRATTVRTSIVVGLVSHHQAPAPSAKTNASASRSALGAPESGLCLRSMRKSSKDGLGLLID